MNVQQFTALNPARIYYTVSDVPGRKRKALVRAFNGDATIMAYFVSEAAAKQFIDEVSQ